MATCSFCNGTGLRKRPPRGLGYFGTGSCGGCAGTGQVDEVTRKQPLYFGRELGSSSSRTSTSKTSRQKKQPSVADEIAKLAKLRDEGVLTEHEFQKAKSKILNE